MQEGAAVFEKRVGSFITGYTSPGNEADPALVSPFSVSLFPF